MQVPFSEKREKPGEFHEEPHWGLSNPQPVFFSFAMEPPSPDSRVTS